MEILFIGVGVVLGAIIGFLIGKQQVSSVNNSDDSAQLNEKIQELSTLLTITQTEKRGLEEDVHQFSENLQNTQRELKELLASKAELKSDLENELQRVKEVTGVKNEVEEKYTQTQNDLLAVKEQLATEKANNKALIEKISVQKEEVNNLREQFNLEFQNIANKILEENSTKFTKTNQEQLAQVLKPLGENIAEFKKQVADSYSEERKEVFSLGNMVKELTELNKTMSEETKNLTQALKGESKTQGLWGEMILESILEKSGLRKDEEYFMEEQLTDDQGKALRSDSENKKMRPDAVIKYPDNRTVIIDSKVSLNAFARYIETDDVEKQQVEIKAHVQAIKNHITALSAKGYDDFDKSLDFVLMFIPSESAYIAAVKEDPSLWEFAYAKRILLMNPTNLVTSLKLIVDLWKREHQNQNAQQIADRGAKLYDKFVGFVENLEKVGGHIKKASDSYQDAYKQLSTGNDNLVRQAEKLKKLGIKNKKELAITSASNGELGE